MSPDDQGLPPAAPPGLTPEMQAHFDAPPEPGLDDPDNPEWTEADFARAKGPESLPPEILAAFPHTLAHLEDRGAAPPGLTALPLDPDVIAYFKAGGADWRARINAVLRAAMETPNG